MNEKLTTESLIAFIKTKDPKDSFFFPDVEECVLAQWLRSMDPEARAIKHGRNSFMYIFEGERVDLGQWARVSVHGNSTFGSALEAAMKG